MSKVLYLHQTFTICLSAWYTHFGMLICQMWLYITKVIWFNCVFLPFLILLHVWNVVSSSNFHKLYALSVDTIMAYYGMQNYKVKKLTYVIIYVYVSVVSILCLMTCRMHNFRGNFWIYSGLTSIISHILIWTADKQTHSNYDNKVFSKLHRSRGQTVFIKYSFIFFRNDRSMSLPLSANSPQSTVSGDGGDNFSLSLLSKADRTSESPSQLTSNSSLLSPLRKMDFALCK